MHRTKKTILSLLIASGAAFGQSHNPKDVASQYFASLEAGDFESLGALLADDIIWHQPGKSVLSGTYQGKEQVFSLFGRFMEISQGSFSIDAVEHIMANGDTVASTLHFSASYGDQAISMNGVDVMRVVEGQIQEVWLYSADQDKEDAFWGLNGEQLK